MGVLVNLVGILSDRADRLKRRRDNDEAEWLRVTDVAATLGVSANTVRRWTDNGRIAAFRSPGGHRRYLAADVLALRPELQTGAGRPGDLAEAHRANRELRAALGATVELTALLAEAPEEVPEKVATMLCELTGAPRCDVYLVTGDSLRSAVAVEAGERDESRTGLVWPVSDWPPVDGDPATAEPVFIRTGARPYTDRGGLALRRRGCRSLAWVPMTANGVFVGTIELTDVRDHDFSPHGELLAGLARLCANAFGVRKAFGDLSQHDRTARELMELSLEVAETHDLDLFIARFAQRLLTAVNADCVDVLRADGGVIRGLVSVTRDAVDATREPAVLDTSKYPSLERTLLDHTPLAIDDLRDPRLSSGEVATYREWGYASSLTMPLVAGGDLVGLVELYDDAERHWEPEIEFLTGVCQLVAGLFDNAALLEEVQDRARLRQELVDLGADLAGAEAATDIAERAAARLRRVVGGADCDIWWLEEGYLRCLGSVDAGGVDESVRGNILRLDHYPSTKQALEDRDTLVIGSLDDPRLTDFEREDWGEFGFRSCVSIPLVSNGLVVGLIDLFDVKERDFAGDTEFLVSAGRTIADALHRAQLLAGLRRGNTVLRELVELGDQLNESGTLEELARQVARRLRATLHAEDCDIWQVDGDKLRCLASIDSRGWDEDEIGSERDLPRYAATVAALAANEPLLVGDLDAVELVEEELAAYRRWGYRSMVSLPLVVEGRPIGLIDVFDTKVRDYSDVLDFIRNVGRLLAGSFEKAMLVERLENRNRDLHVLVDSGMEFAATLDVDTLLLACAERIREVSRADFCDIYRLEGEEIQAVVWTGGTWDDDAIAQRYRLEDYSVLARAAATREPAVSVDLTAEPGATTVDLTEAAKWGYRAAAGVPLVSHGEVIGFVKLMNREPRRFARMATVVGLAQMAGQAVANAALYREVGDNLRRMALVSESSLELASSLDLRETLAATARRLCSVVGVHECEITVIEGDDLHTLMRVNHGEIDHDWLGRHLALADAAVTREVIESRRPTVVGSLRDPRLTPAVQEINREFARKSWLTLPLIAKDRVIGSVELVESGVERTFEQTEIDTAAAICHAAALAIENAALFEREQSAAREAQLLNDIARRTAATLDLEAVVQSAVEELRQLVAFDDYALLLFGGDVVRTVISSRVHADDLVGLAVDDLDPDAMADVRAGGVTVMRLPESLALPPSHPAITGLHSAAAITLRSDTGFLGVLVLASRREDGMKDIDTALLERVGIQLSLAIKNAKLYDEIKQMHLGNLKALSSALNAKDYYTLGHAARVAAYTVMLGRRLGWSDDVLTPLEEAAYLHDIGKISISDRVLLKPSRLNPQEWEQMREHPVISADIIRPLFPEALVQAVRHHHERWDGTGYPDGLAGDDIPLLARAMAVVDSYDAMSCRRPYRASLSYPECVAELGRCRGTQFDPEIVDAFLDVLDEVAERRVVAERVAAEAAGRIRGERHNELRSREDESSSAYLEICDILREVRDAHPPTRFLTTHTRIEKGYVIGVDPEEDEATRSHFGDEIFPDDELTTMLEGGRADVNTVFADEFGVWITGLAPVRDAAGQIVAVVAADQPALAADGGEVAPGESRQSFAEMLQTAAVRLSRAEIDAITDALTGLYNHRYLHERLSEELHRAREHGHPLSVLFCDLDHFKGYNDANGHSAGDAVLREVAHVLDQAVRNVDIAGRYGGEEFVVILVETARDKAYQVAERIRERIRAAGFSANGLPLTVSIGVATCPDDAERREDLIDKADWAMYLAKRRGRDQVALFSED